MISAKQSNHKILPNEEGNPNQILAGPQEINAENVNDRAKLLTHRFLAGWIRRDPEILTAALRRLGETVGPEPGFAQEWRNILRLPSGEVAVLLVSRSEGMTRLRVSSSFTLPSRFQDPTLRKRLWRKARLGLELNAVRLGK